MSNPIPKWKRKYDLIFDQQTKRNAQVSIRKIQPENGQTELTKEEEKKINAVDLLFVERR